MIGSIGISRTALALALVLGSSTASAAAAPPEEPLDAVIYGKRRPEPAPTIRIPFGDLDLRQKSGERQLLLRVKARIARACRSDSALEGHYCRNQAVSRARSQIRQAVYNARNTVGFVRLTEMFITVPPSE